MMQDILNNIIQAVGGYIPSLIGAVIILIVGWLAALIVSAGVRGALRRTKLDTKLASLLFGEEERARVLDVTRTVGKGVFWVIMFLVLVAFLQALDLTLATDPINRLLSQVFQFLPRLFGAGALLLIAWILGSLLRLIILRVLGAAKLDERIGGRVGPEGEKAMPLTKTIAGATYWLIFLVFLPAILGALALRGLLEPVQGMLDSLLGFLPNLLAAALIGVIGWFVARIVQRIVANLLAAAGVDTLSERIGGAPLSGIVGLIVYILILVPVMIGALSALELDAITGPASAMLNMVLKAIPIVFAAAMVVVIAYVVGRVVSRVITDLLTGIGFNAILVRLGIGKEPEEGKRTPSMVIGYLVLLAIMLFAVLEASSLLGFEQLSDLIAALAVFGGDILLGVIILGIGLYLANLASKAIQAGGSPQAGLLAIVARVAILLLATSIALHTMGLANEVINLAFGLVLGAVAVAVAIAFGIGGRDIAARKLSQWTESTKSE